jgi:hypothetical protein
MINNPKSEKVIIWSEGEQLVLISFKSIKNVILFSSLRWSMRMKTIERKISHLYVSFVDITLMAQGSIKVIIKKLKSGQNLVKES